MQSTDWAPEHSEALREYLAKGMSFSETVNTINARFKTAYTRSAAIGRARRIGFGHPGGRSDVPKLQEIKPQEIKPQEANLPWLGKLCERHVPERSRLLPVLERSQPIELRSVSIVPRRLPLVDLEPGDCRYPYGGDEEGEAITFCGHPQREESSYCTAHFHLTRVLLRVSKRAGRKASLKLVEVA